MRLSALQKKVRTAPPVVCYRPCTLPVEVGCDRHCLCLLVCLLPVSCLHACQNLEALTALPTTRTAPDVASWLVAREGRLNLLQVGVALLRLSTSPSPKLKQIFEAYADPTSGISHSRWQDFVREQQVVSAERDSHDHAAAEELLEAEQDYQAWFAASAKRHSLSTDAGMSLQDFAIKLLDPRNDAVADSTKGAVKFMARDMDLRQPLAHYYTSCSHNSCKPQRGSNP